jgi:hypothetical protein
MDIVRKFLVRKDVIFCSHRTLLSHFQLFRPDVLVFGGLLPLTFSGTDGLFPGQTFSETFSGRLFPGRLFPGHGTTFSGTDGVTPVGDVRGYSVCPRKALSPVPEKPSKSPLTKRNGSPG